MKRIKVRHRGENALSELTGEELEEYRQCINSDLERGRRMADEEEPNEDHPKIKWIDTDLDKNGKGTTVWEFPSKERVEEILNKLDLPYSDLQEI